MRGVITGQPRLDLVYVRQMLATLEEALDQSDLLPTFNDLYCCDRSLSTVSPLKIVMVGAPLLRQRIVPAQSGKAREVRIVRVELCLIL